MQPFQIKQYTFLLSYQSLQKASSGAASELTHSYTDIHFRLPDDGKVVNSCFVEGIGKGTPVHKALVFKETLFADKGKDSPRTVLIVYPGNRFPLFNVQACGICSVANKPYEIGSCPYIGCVNSRSFFCFIFYRSYFFRFIFLRGFNFFLGLRYFRGFGFFWS
ncbi:predicted protein [Methanosarcina acetivorans C2A]|uniref:Uncharacterized protein n=1 Tax=Methanosarcina acetivorans (strain ATCC 35395 / DSM 2834 / JCM 12185 / C2A) TaxID=188937 RepID=Q8TQT6_METAC|nr:predicted protein [Methanosarcina acetivorans C2A]